MINYICSSCGKEVNEKRRYPYPNHLCQSCYNYFKNGGKINPIPPKGEIHYDDRGYVICHICGRAYRRLGSHLKESHNMTIYEYKERFGLCNNSKTTEKNYSEMMSKLAYKYDMPNRLIESGKNTRVKKGERNLRQGKKSRLQECLDRKNRMIGKGGI